MSIKLSIFFFLIGFFPYKSFAQHSKDSVNTVIDDPVMPVAQFPGGDKALMKFIRLHLHPIKGAIGKKVFVNFIVEKDGRLTHFKVVRGISKEADEEALRILRLSPKWRPVIYKGKAEASYYTVPIVFSK